MKKILSVLLCSTLILISLIFPVDASNGGNNFIDVNPESWYNRAIVQMKFYKIMVGTSKNTFSPDMLLTREQSVVALYHAIYQGSKLLSHSENWNVSEVPLNPPHYEKMSFSDVRPNMWYSDYIEFAFQNGWTAGIGNGKFGLGQILTRQDVAVLLKKYYYNTDDFLYDYWINNNTSVEPSYYNYALEHQYPYSSLDWSQFFADYNEISKYAIDALKKLFTPYLTNNSIGEIEEVAAIPPTFNNYVNWNNSINPKAYVTRAEMAYLLWNVFLVGM